jgi:hypothetical protein
MDITGIGEAATAAQKILAMIFPDKTEQEKSQLAAALALVQAQTDINKAEAQSSDPLEHWRGAMGWVCALAYFNNFVLMPWGNALGLHIPTIDIEPLSALTLGMLGLGGMHVYQKVNQ